MKNNEYDAVNTRQRFLSIKGLLCLCILLLPLSSALAQANTASLKLDKVPLKQAIEKVETTFDIFFLYNSKLINDTQLVSVNKNNVGVTEILDALLRGTGIKFRIVDKQVILYVKDLAEVSDMEENPNSSVGPNGNTGKAVDGSSTGTKQDVRTVRGVVKDEQGEPLPGAIVVIKNTKRNVMTNDKGAFELSDVAPDATLIVSFLGYEPLEYPLNGLTNIELALIPNVMQLEEVVMTGYQTLSRERATGSFDVLPKSQLEKPALNIASRLIGTVAGVAATLDEDGNPTLEIRGQTSIFANNQPLVVVDGFAIEGNFSTINPNDVESVTLLKDAAAASIWGARAANGVIVVVTKKPSKNESLKIEFNSFVRFGAKLDLDYVNPLAGSAETVEYEKMVYNKWGSSPNFAQYTATRAAGAWSQGLVAINDAHLGYITEQQRDATLDQLKTYDNRQQISDNMLAMPVNQQYNLTISTANSRNQNIFSLMFTDNQSNFQNTGNQQYSINYRNSSKVFKWLDFYFSGMFQYNKSNNSGCDLSSIRGLSPYDMLLNPDGSFANVVGSFYWPALERDVPMEQFPYTDWTFNPIREMNNRELGNEELNARIQTGLTFKIIDGLTFDSKIQYELFNTFYRNLYGEETSYVKEWINQTVTWDRGTGAITLNLPKGSILDQSRQRLDGYNFRNQLNFNRSFGKHDINFVGGAEITSRITQSFYYPRTYGYNNNTLSVGTFPNGSGDKTSIPNWIGQNQYFGYTNGFGYSTDRYFSMYANAAYTFNNKYTLSGSYRADASNLITDDPKYRYAPFWSVGMSWQLSKEKFMQNISWINRLALRATYGFNGNVDRSTAFMPLINTSGAPNRYTKDYTATIASYGNPTLRWERVATTDIGIDYVLFKGKLFGKFDLYNKNGQDMIAPITIASVNGTTTQKLNVAGMINRGIEVEIGTDLNVYKNKIRWIGGVNFSYNYNKISSMYKASYTAGELCAGGEYAYVEGKNANSLWAFKYAGTYNIGTETSPNWQPMVENAATGELHSFSGMPTSDGRDFMLDMGTTVAPYNVGLTSQFKIYDFDLSFIITGKFGHVFKHHSFNYPWAWAGRVLPNERMSEVVNGDPMKIITLPSNPAEPNFSFWNRFYSYVDYLVDNASHVRMQEVNLTYNLPEKICTDIGITRAQIYFQGNNLFIITANKYHEDPEYPLGTVRPQPKFTFGLNLTF